MRGIGREKESLYIVKSSFTNECFININLQSNAQPVKPINPEIWHQRLGYPHVQVMRKLSAAIDCPICPLAKQSRLTFPTSISRISRPLEMIHLDVWGPYKIPTHDRKSLFLTIVDDLMSSFSTDSLICFL